MITTVIFDFGGVLTQGRYTKRLLSIIEKKYPISAEEIYPKFNSFMVLMDKSQLDFEGFIKHVNSSFNLSLSLDEMNAFFLEAVLLNTEVISLVKTIRKKYKTAILSDNNPPLVRILRTHHKDLLDLFEKTYFSCELNFHKPQKAFYEYVAKDLGVTAQECVFIDDKEKNANGAEEAGMKGIVFTDIDQLNKDFNSLQIL